MTSVHVSDDYQSRIIGKSTSHINSDASLNTAGLTESVARIFAGIWAPNRVNDQSSVFVHVKSAVVLVRKHERLPHRHEIIDQINQSIDRLTGRNQATKYGWIYTCKKFVTVHWVIIIINAPTYELPLHIMTMLDQQMSTANVCKLEQSAMIRPQLSCSAPTTTITTTTTTT